MSKNVPRQGSVENWLATLQEAHRYIIHYSTVRLSLVTFLVTAMFTALLYGLPKETVALTSDSVAIYTGGLNWPAIAVAILLYLSAFFLNRVFDKRRYMMERFAADIEIILNAKSRQPTQMLPTQTTREHQLDKLDSQDINVILNQTKIADLQEDYAKGYRCFLLYGQPTLNVIITWAFTLVFMGISVLICLSLLKADHLRTCTIGKEIICTSTLVGP
jgi:hypothetical protein